MEQNARDLMNRNNSLEHMKKDEAPLGIEFFVLSLLLAAAYLIWS